MEQLERAKEELRDQNFGSAIRSLELITARDPEEAGAWKYLARAYHGTGRRDEAATAAQRYASLRPDDAMGHYNAGVVLMQIGRPAEAQASLNAALKVDPGHAKARRAIHKLNEQAQPPDAGSPSAAAPMPRPTPKGDHKRPMPLAAKIAAGLTVVACLAILASLFLRGGPADPGPETAAPQDTETGISTPSPELPSAAVPDTTRTPEVVSAPTYQPDPSVNTPATTPTPDPQPVQPLPDQPQPSAPSPGNTSGPQSLFTPQQAEQVAQAINEAHQSEVAAAHGQIGAIAQMIRNLDEEIWRDGGRDALVLQASGLLAATGSAGSLQALSLISTAETPAIAANNLEAYARSLPPALTPQQLLAIQQVLTQPGITPDQGYYAIKRGFEQWGIGLLDGPDRALRRHLNMPPPTGSSLLP